MNFLTSYRLKQNLKRILRLKCVLLKHFTTLVNSRSKPVLSKDLKTTSAHVSKLFPQHLKDKIILQKATYQDTSHPPTSHCNYIITPYQTS